MRYLVPALRTLTVDHNGGALSGTDYLFRWEEEIRRSRFITHLGHAPNRETAGVFIEAVKREFSDATHNCWAYAAGKPGDTASIGQSDDGEPHGTAGRPMLNQLLYGGVGEVVAVTTRYFGGVKLGTGGLARAYQNGVAQALATVPKVEKTVCVFLEVSVAYTHVSRLHRLLAAHQARIVQENFTEKARYQLELPIDRLEAFRAALIQATDGTADFPPFSA